MTTNLFAIGDKITNTISNRTATIVGIVTQHIGGEGPRTPHVEGQKRVVYRYDDGRMPLKSSVAVNEFDDTFVRVAPGAEYVGKTVIFKAYGKTYVGKVDSLDGNYLAVQNPIDAESGRNAGRWLFLRSEVVAAL